MNVLVEALNDVVFYNGLSGNIKSWKEKIKKPGDYIETDFNTGEQIVYMIAVILYGEYGTSPRSGWINNIDAFYHFIDMITESEDMV